MGTWNAKPFGNDTAGDWLWALEKAKDESVLVSALEAVLSAKEALDASQSEEGIAAAAVIEASRRNPIGKLPQEAKQWVSTQGFMPSGSLVEQAIKAVERIASESELRELWEASPSFAKWQKEIETLLARLRAVKSLPALTRKSKPPSARLSLPKLIERINFDEESPLRQKLRKKLEAIDDVNAPVDGTHFETPLNLVAGRGFIPEAQRLIERGAKVNPELRDPLNLSTPLEEACAFGRVEMAKFLLSHGAEIYFARELDVMSPDGQFGKKVFRFPRALYRAVESGDIATVEILVHNGADLCDKRCKKEALRCHAMHYETLLHRAVSAGRPEMVEYLAKNGLELDARDALGDTPLQHAVSKRRLDLVQKLLGLGAAVNAKDADGNTALDFVDNRKSELWKALRRQGGKLGEEA